MTKATSLRPAPSQVGMRVDHFLADELGVTRAHARRLLAEGRVRIGDRVLARAAKGRAVAADVELEIEDFRRPERQSVRPEPFEDAAGRVLEAAPIRAVLADGPGWVAVDKRAGAPVHPLREDEGGTVLNVIAARWPGLQGVGEGGLRSGVVHRLDVETSGVLLVATDEAAWARIRGGFREHRVEKRYRAIVIGQLEAQHDLTLGLAVARHRPARVRVFEHWDDDAGGARARRGGSKLWIARQHVTPIEHLDTATLVEVRPKTGFLHQIRATLAHLGHPVAGDAVYGDARVDPTGARRQMLHAASIRFDEISADSPDPEDFRSVLERGRGRGRP